MSRLDELKPAVEEHLGPLQWIDSRFYGGSAIAELSSGEEVSVMADPPEGQKPICLDGETLTLEELTNIKRVTEIVSPEWRIPEGNVEIGPLGATITGPLELDDWLGYMASLYRFNKSLGWIIGDLLNYGEAAYGERHAQAYAVAEGLGYSVATIQQWKSVAGRIPMSERREDVSWNCWRYLAGKEPEDRERGIDLYIDGHPTAEVKEILEGDGDPIVIEPSPPCPICGGATRGNKCRECNADFKAVAWHFAEQKASILNRLVDVVSYWLEMETVDPPASIEDRIAAREDVAALLREMGR